jgi:carboxyl-terminal processing protease
MMAGPWHPCWQVLPPCGDGHLGSFVDYAGQAQEQWYLRGSNFYLDTLAVTAPPAPVIRVPSNRPIAVLISGLTASSGDIVAISLKGRPDTRFFGEPTYGATTANTSYPLQGSSHLKNAFKNTYTRWKGFLENRPIGAS